MIDLVPSLEGTPLIRHYITENIFRQYDSDSGAEI